MQDYGGNFIIASDLTVYYGFYVGYVSQQNPNLLLYIHIAHYLYITH